MIREIKEKTAFVTYEEIIIGDTFKYQGDYYIKTAIYDGTASVNIKDGTTTVIANDETVIKVDMIIEILI